MKIISIHRDTELQLPDVFTVGTVPMIEGEAVAENPAIKSIVFLETGVAGAFNGRDRGGCYLVEFIDSNVKRVIPADDVKEVAYESEKESKTKLKKAPVIETVEATE